MEVKFKWFFYASKSSNWERMAGERDETIDQLQTEVDKLTAELNAQTDLTLTYAGAFSCTAYCSEEYAHICGEGHGITSSGAKVQPGVTVAADTSVLPYGTVVYIEGIGIRVVQDTGSAVVGNKLDVAVKTHSEALRTSRRIAATTTRWRSTTPSASATRAASALTSARGLLFRSI